MALTIREITEILASADIPNARHEAVILIEEFEKTARHDIYAFPLREYSSEALAAAVKKRAERYPLQYIIGKWEFCGLEFTVDESCLIPRADTEVIAERAARIIPDGGELLDLCTGSGCILAAVLALSADKNTRGTGVELYPATALTAEKNIRTLELYDRAKIIVGDATLDLFPRERKFDVITANPPYIAENEMPQLEPELGFEPRAALTDGGDGLSLIRAIVKIYKNHLADGGIMLIEHGYRQAEDVHRIAQECGMEYECIYDFGGNTRGAVLRNA